jgi:hypothetical protein
MPRIAFEPKATSPLRKMANIWERTSLRGAPGFFEGIAARGGAVSRTGVIVDQNGLVYRGRDKFPGGTFFFRGEPVGSSTGLIGGAPLAPIAVELSGNDIHSNRVALRVYPIGRVEAPYYIGVSEILDPKSNPIFHVDRAAGLNEDIQGSISVPFDLLPPDVVSAWEKCARLAANSSPDGHAEINVRIGKGFELRNIVHPTITQDVKDVRFAYGRRENGDLVGQLTFFGVVPFRQS